MNTKHILLIGGGAAFAAIATVGLMKAFSSPDPVVTSPEAGRCLESGAVETLTATPKVRNAPDRTDVSPVLDKLSQDLSSIDPEEFEKQRDEFRDAMRERQMERLTTKMAQWSGALGLGEDQQKKLLDIADSQFDELEQLAATAEGENPDPTVLSESAKRAMAIMSGRAMEESMAEMLTPAQQEKFEAFGNRQAQSRAEARTLRQLATLQEDLMLTPEQRNDVYGIIYEDNLQEVESNSDVSSMIDQFASQSGVAIDPSLQGMISSLANRGLEEMASGNELNGESIQNMAETALNDSITQQVNLLRPVLTENQLEIYRSQLEGRLQNISDMIPRDERNGGGE